MIERYRHLEIPAGGYAAANFCSQIGPPPGTSEQLRARARALSATAQAVRDAMARLRAISNDESSWTGAAAEAFRAAVQEPAKSHINKVPERYDGYARQLISYASALDDAQTKYRAALARVADALAMYHAAKASGGNTPHVTDCAEQECRTAARQFIATHNVWVDAVNRCINGLKSIDTHDKLHNPHGVQAAADGVAHVMDEVGNLSAVLALVTLALCPELSVVLFAISTVASGVKLVADADRKMMYGEDINWRTFAFDALGSVPLGAPMKGAVTAAKEAKAARGLAGVAGRAGSAVNAFGRELGREYTHALFDDPARGLRELKAHGKSGASPSWRRTGAAIGDMGKQDVLGYPASYADNAWQNHRHGWAQAIGWSAFRVTWAPVGPMLPAGLAKQVGDHIGPLARLPRVLERLGW